MPERFQMTFVGEDGQKHQPYMVHRALLGSLERFFGVLVEHHAGAFPLWLAPEQIRILPITERQHAVAAEITAALKAKGIRAEADYRPEAVGAKIKDARNSRIPYMGVIGDREAESKSLSVRSRKEDQLGVMSLDNLAEKMLSEVAAKA
jgi:threonyl-tRNA synthetase